MGRNSVEDGLTIERERERERESERRGRRDAEGGLRWVKGIDGKVGG